MTERLGFYERVLRALLDQRLIERDARVLVVAGGEVDREAFAALGFTEVTITNLSQDGDERQDAEALTYPDDSFDVAVISIAHPSAESQGIRTVLDEVTETHPLHASPHSIQPC